MAFDGSVNACRRSILISETSGFRMTLQICSRASLALVFTFGCVSEKASVNFGTTLGRQLTVRLDGENIYDKKWGKYE